MIIAHLSDIHISKYGTLLVQRRGLPREARPDEKAWETMLEVDGWRVETRRAGQTRFSWRDRMRLVDPDGLIHHESNVPKDTEKPNPEELLALQTRRARVSIERLANDWPSRAQIDAWLGEDPHNGNLRWCAIAHQLREENPDYVLITGDLTDDAEGFELIEAGLAPFIAEGRLIVIPGNHDIYPSPPLVTVASARKTELDKRRLWGAFTKRIGVEASGCFVRDLGEGVLLLCLDSSHPPRIPASASGYVQPHELYQLAGQLDASGPGQLRLACVHHHIANPPPTALGSVPFQTGMKLRNAREVLDVLESLDVRVIMNGHRHIGYRFQPSGSPLFLSAPSTTMGCRSGAKPFYWRLHIHDQRVNLIEEAPVRLEAPIAMLDNPVTIYAGPEDLDPEPTTRS